MVSASGKRLVIIDGNHLIHRAFHAIQAPLRTSSGEQTNAIYGFASMLLNILELEHPDYLVMTFDEKGPTFRHDVHEGYKATRAKAPDELYAQMPRIHEMVRRFKIPLFSKDGFEADDMMGTLARKAESLGITSLIVTGDMDALQLINPHTFVVFPHKGYKEPVVFDAQKVIEKYSIRPDQVVDYKALVGDTSDNIKGVQGIGPKGATELLHRYDTLEGIYDHLDGISLLMRKKLEDDRESAFFSKMLAKIVTDVPCDFKAEDAEVSELDYQGLKRFFEEMEIHSLQKRLQKIMPEEARVGKAQMSLF